MKLLDKLRKIRNRSRGVKLPKPGTVANSPVSASPEVNDQSSDFSNLVQRRKERKTK